MRSVAARGARARPRVLVQGRAPKQQLLEDFRQDGRALLVATMSFWEGVDVPGRALRLVVLEKIPFGVPTDPVVRARAAALEARGGDPFRELIVPAAAIMLKQGFGRLLRRQQDRGIVALLDGRVLRRGYGKQLLAGCRPPRAPTRSVGSGSFGKALGRRRVDRTTDHPRHLFRLVRPRAAR